MRLYKCLSKDKTSKHTSNTSTLKDIKKTKKEQEWLKENKEAINGQNERITKYGCFSDAYRRF